MKLITKNTSAILSTAIGLFSGISVGKIVKEVTDNDKAAVAATIGTTLVVGGSAQYALNCYMENNAELPELVDDDDDELEPDSEDYADLDIDILVDDTDIPVIDEQAERDAKLRSNAEILRDFCGSFHELRASCRNYGLLYEMPNAIRRVCEAAAIKEDISKAEAEYNITEMMATVTECWLDDDRTKDTIRAFMEPGNFSAEKVSPLVIAWLLDIAYIDCMSTVFEEDALEHVENVEFGPVLSEEELKTYNERKFNSETHAEEPKAPAPESKQAEEPHEETENHEVSASEPAVDPN